MALQPGVVRDQIVKYLRAQGVDGAKLLDIHAAVEEALGERVGETSVRSYLRLNTPDKFEKVSWGKYRLKP